MYRGVLKVHAESAAKNMADSACRNSSVSNKPSRKRKYFTTITLTTMQKASTRYLNKYKYLD